MEEFLEVFERLLADTRFQLIAEEHLPARPRVLAPIPSGIPDAIRELLLPDYPAGLYSHQARGLVHAFHRTQGGVS